MCESKHIQMRHSGWKQKESGRNQTTATMSSDYTFKDLLEGELFNSGVWHQVQEDFEGLSRLKGLLRQPEEHVLV